MWHSQTPQVDKGVLYWWLINLKQFLMISFSLISAQRNNKIESFWVYSWLKTGSVHVHQTGAFISLVTTWHVFRSAAMKTVSMTVSRLGMTDLFTSASYCKVETAIIKSNDPLWSKSGQTVVPNTLLKKYKNTLIRLQRWVWTIQVSIGRRC